MPAEAKPRKSSMHLATGKTGSSENRVGGKETEGMDNQKPIWIYPLDPTNYRQARIGDNTIYIIRTHLVLHIIKLIFFS